MNEEGKKAAARKAAFAVREGMVLGLGTGSTVDYFIEFLGERCQKGLSIRAVASSLRSSQKAIGFGIHLADLNEVSHVDLTVDGADQVTPQKEMIKGKGGAFFREKILASSSKSVLIIIDHSKQVPFLGKDILPVEIAWFGAMVTKRKLENMGYSGAFRMDDHSFFCTENGNLILDLFFEKEILDPVTEHQKISQIPGVLDTGFFFGLAHQVFVGYSETKVEILS